MRGNLIGLAALIVGLLLGGLLACALTSRAAPKTLPHRPIYESYDQERLKANDHGCPTAIYVAPNGVLTQCPPM
jgi:hypothetical protein